MHSMLGVGAHSMYRWASTESTGASPFVGQEGVRRMLQQGVTVNMRSPFTDPRTRGVGIPGCPVPGLYVPTVANQHFTWTRDDLKS